MRLRVCVCVHVCACVCVHVCVCSPARAYRLSPHTFACVCVCVHVCVFMCVRSCVCVLTCKGLLSEPTPS